MEKLFSLLTNFKGTGVKGTQTIGIKPISRSVADCVFQCDDDGGDITYCDCGGSDN